MLKRIYDKSHQGTANAMLWSRMPYLVRLIIRLVGLGSVPIRYMRSYARQAHHTPEDINISIHHLSNSRPFCPVSTARHEISVLRGISLCTQKVAVPRTPQIINIPSSFVPWQLEKYLIRSPGEDERIIAARWGNTESSLCSVNNNPQRGHAVRSLGQLRVSESGLSHSQT